MVGIARCSSLHAKHLQTNATNIIGRYLLHSSAARVRERLTRLYTRIDILPLDSSRDRIQKCEARRNPLKNSLSYI